MPQWVISLPERLDVFLAANADLGSRAKAQQAIEGRLVKVNDVVVTKPALRLQAGDRVELLGDLPVTPAGIKPVDLKLLVLYEDDACMVLKKPAGISVHPGAGMTPGETTMLHGIAFLFQKRSLPFSEGGVLVHRLDKDTTGCLLVAKSPKAHQQLQQQFETRSVTKIYLALVSGIPDPPAAMIDAPIGRATSDRTKMAVTGHAGAVREAYTTYRTLAKSPTLPAALIACELHTGRTHQIRVHLAAVGHPVLGDDTYATAEGDRISADLEIPSQCLHAWKLTMRSPADGNEHEVVAPLPEEFTDVMKALGIPLDAVR